MVNPEKLIDRYYAREPELERILLLHSEAVTRKALSIAMAHPEWQLNVGFLREVAMLHDIGIIYTDAPAIACYGTEPYICHGLLGAELLRREGLPQHARVAERHTGTGLTRRAIEAQHLPLPDRDFTPETLEEKIICYADKFFSKTRLNEEKTTEQVVKSLQRFGQESVDTFLQWNRIFEDKVL
ncbi:MAG: HDIG domain-containing protein [Bacteroidaceae bacterium]|nr:HDIG domain-containing protein [Bacteroidaceae bacterium]